MQSPWDITSSIFLEIFIVSWMNFLSLKLHCKCTAATSKIYIILIKEPSTRPLLSKEELPHPIFNILILRLLFFPLFCSILILFCLDRSKISSLIRHSYLRASSFHSLFLCFYFILLVRSKISNLIQHSHLRASCLCSLLLHFYFYLFEFKQAL